MLAFHFGTLIYLFGLRARKSPYIGLLTGLTQSESCTGFEQQLKMLAFKSLWQTYFTRTVQFMESSNIDLSCGNYISAWDILKINLLTSSCDVLYSHLK